MLLDEATASLDSHTEKQIQSALEAVTSNHTTITIAFVTPTHLPLHPTSREKPLLICFVTTICRHRLSTITKAQQILVMHDGKIVERGTHPELLRLGGRYSSMWERQTQAARTGKEKWLRGILSWANYKHRHGEGGTWALKRALKVPKGIPGALGDEDYYLKRKFKPNTYTLASCPFPRY